MENITFEEEERLKHDRFLTTKNRSSMVKFLIGHHIATTEKAANAIIVIFAIIFLLAAIVLAFMYAKPNNQPDTYLQTSEAIDQTKVVLKRTTTISNKATPSVKPAQ